MNRSEILEHAHQCVTQDRASTHGGAENTFGMIAAVWSARFGLEITPEQVAIMLIDLKTCRAWGNPGHADNWVDTAGYAACGGELAMDGAMTNPTTHQQQQIRECRHLLSTGKTPDYLRGAGYAEAAIQAAQREQGE